MMIMSISLSLMFITLTHPLSMGLILLIQTTLISLMTGSFSYNFWYSYILFLIMIGGMLILFIYMTSIASNEKFSLNFKTLLISSLMPLSAIILTLNIYITDASTWNSLTNMKNMQIYISMIKFMYLPMNIILMFMIMYLFLTMIAIVKIINKKTGPLRQKH
uniref:NADH dehydrogenase subunit 6 n=1 Tax=Cissites auriculata TaxID=1288037 RepID=UPI001FA752A9|nr:NADH dehydrogenase subunit 6 [Cissites auriculata]UMR54831.1 NADH dehydrogenase subunit 6 [Cissites auriculata]